MKDCDIYHHSRVIVNLIIAIFYPPACRSKDMPYCSSVVAFILIYKDLIFNFEYMVQTTLHFLLTHQQPHLSITETRICFQWILPLIDSALCLFYLICILYSDDELTFVLLCEEIIEESGSKSSYMHESGW